MTKIVRSPQTLADIAEIWHYIAIDSEKNADLFVAEIDQKFHLLSCHPNIGTNQSDLFSGLQSFPVGKYLVFYRQIIDGIEIVRVLHGARDIEAMLLENKEEEKES